MVEEIALPSARLGTHRVLTVHRFGTPGARPKAYLQAALHADETPGMLVAHHLISLLRSATVVGEVVIVPVANPVGLAQVVEGTHVGRYALDGGGNFNRQFPDLTDAAAARLSGRLDGCADAVSVVREALRAAHAGITPATEVAALRHALLGLALDADLVLDLHCDQEAVPHLYAGEALWPALSDVAAELGCQAVLLERDSGGAPFDEACAAPWWRLAARFGAGTSIPAACAAATVELRGKADVSDALAEADARALLRVLVRRGIVAGEAAPPPPLTCEATPLAGLERLTAPHPGVIAFHRAVGERLAPGDLVAEIVDPTAAAPADERTPLRAGTAGILMARSNRRFAGMGELVASIAGRDALERTGRGLLFD